MSNQESSTRMVSASSVRDWLLWLGEHFDRDLDTQENREIRRLGRTIEDLGDLAGAIDTTGEKYGQGACLLDAFDWEHGAIDFAHPRLLTNRLGSPDPEALIARLVEVTGIPERAPYLPPEPEYVV